MATFSLALSSLLLILLLWLTLELVAAPRFDYAV
jgi:hypothetical protein